MIGALVQLERLVARPGRVVELPAAARLRGLVVRAVKDEQRKLEVRELVLEAVVGADHLGDGLSRLLLIGDQGVGVHLPHDRRVA